MKGIRDTPLSQQKFIEMVSDLIKKRDEAIIAETLIALPEVSNLFNGHNGAVRIQTVRGWLYITHKRPGTLE